MGWHTSEPAKRYCEMALIGKSASQSNLGKLQLWAGQERMRSSNANPPYIFADRAGEIAMELTADLNGMSPGATREFSKTDTRVFLLM